MIYGFLVWSDSVRNAAAVVLMYRFTAVAHVLLYSSTTRYSGVYNNNVRFTAVGRLTSGFEPSLCVFFRIFFVLFLGG